MFRFYLCQFSTHILISCIFFILVFAIYFARLHKFFDCLYCCCCVYMQRQFRFKINTLNLRIECKNVCFFFLYFSVKLNSCCSRIKWHAFCKTINFKSQNQIHFTAHRTKQWVIVNIIIAFPAKYLYSKLVR